MTTVIRRDKFVLTPVCPDGVAPLAGEGNVYYVPHHASDAIRCYSPYTTAGLKGKYCEYTWCGRWACIRTVTSLPK
jgi:hypothetical protein